MKRLIVTADDFGRCLPINEAVEDAHKNGILTSASLMVGGDAREDAVARAKATPSLAVGLHATLVDGKPVLPPEQIADLLEADGRFTSRVVAIGTRIYVDRKVQAQVRAELTAQFEAYAATGLPFDHVDSHHHYHLHPTVFAILLDLAIAFGVPAIRIPYEPPLASWRARGDRLGHRLATGLFHWRTTRKMRIAANEAGLATNDRVFGFADSGRMDAASVAAFLDHLPDGVTELYCHPATHRWVDHPMPEDYRVVEEYRALIDPTVKEKAGRVLLTSFSSLAARQAPCPS
jgi:hopanoid biosynthesis associated protein HpnK